MPNNQNQAKMLKVIASMPYSAIVYSKLVRNDEFFTPESVISYLQELMTILEGASAAAVRDASELERYRSIMSGFREFAALLKEG